MRSREKISKFTQNKWLWVSVALFGIVALLLVFAVFGKNPEEEAKPQKANIPNLTKFGKVKEYTLNIPNKIESDFALNLANFDGNEPWQGNGLYDSRNVFEGESSLYLESTNHAASKVFLESKVNLNNYNFFDIFVYLGELEPQNLEFLSIKFGNMPLNSYYEYVFGGLDAGWNFLRIPKKQFGSYLTPGQAFDWSKIEKIEFSLISRPGTRAIAHFDSFRAEKDLSYLRLWETASKNKDFVGIAENSEGQPVILGQGVDDRVAALAEVGDTENFIFQASVSPQKSGPSGIFFRGNSRNAYGYYFVINGLDSNKWQIMKHVDQGDVVLKEGQVGNITFKSDEKYWLKIIARGSNFKAYLSRDGERFAEVANLNDNEFSIGQVGVVVLDGTFSFFDDFYFKKL